MRAQHLEVTVDDTGNATVRVVGAGGARAVLARCDTPSELLAWLRDRFAANAPETDTLTELAAVRARCQHLEKALDDVSRTLAQERAAHANGAQSTENAWRGLAEANVLLALHGVRRNAGHSVYDAVLGEVKKLAAENAELRNALARSGSE